MKPIDLLINLVLVILIGTPIIMVLAWIFTRPGR